MQPFTPSKALGQNFLKDRNTINTIIKSLNLNSNSRVIELGCGFGALTEEIVKLTTNFIGIEKDIRLYEYLQERFIKTGIVILHADMLKVSFNDLAHRLGGKVIFVGNLPYNISSQIIFKFIDEYLQGCMFEYAVLMFQKEVADRLCASPGTKDYGIATVLINYICDIKNILLVSPKCFYPAPKVYSSVVKLTFREYPLKVLDFNFLKKIVKKAFNMRRKNIFNSLRGIVSDDLLIDALTESGINRNLRAEDLSLDSYIKLSNFFRQKLQESKVF